MMATSTRENRKDNERYSPRVQMGLFHPGAI
jgi:hypothetical protein